MQQVEEPGPEVDKQYSVKSEFANLESIFFDTVTQQFYTQLNVILDANESLKRVCHQ